MKLTDLSISRPVFATVMSLVIVLIGLVSYDRLSVREYPNIDEPAVTITTTYPGANAEIMESQVTKILEDSIAGIEGIKQMSSTSREGTSVINVLFLLDRDPDDAAAEVRDRVSRVRSQLPDEIDEPVVAKVEADAAPIIWVVMQTERLSQAQLTDYADRTVQDRLQNVPGVAQVMIFGARRYAMRIWLDPMKLAAHRVTANDVENALRGQNLDVPSGRVEGSSREFTVLTNSDLNRKEQFENVIVTNRDGHFIQIKDIGRVTLGAEEDRVNFKYKGQPAVGLGIVKQSVANPVEISDAVNKVVPQIRDSLPEGVSIMIGNDTSVFIKQSIKNVYQTLGEAVALVAGVILLFLRSPRASLIPLVTIPVSLIGAFAIMAALGFTINTLTLLAMVLAIGLVVDDAIVVLENIYRHIEDGMEPLAASYLGAKEIGFAVLAMTITLAAVYVPVAFMEGRTGKLFAEFALTLASAVLISGFVALTLSPMMCSKLLRHTHSQNRISATLERWLENIDHAYRHALTRALARRWLVFPFLGIIALATWLTYSSLKSELSPLEDRGLFFTAIIGPEGATVDYMSAYGEQIEKILRDIPEVNRFGIVLGMGTNRLPLSNQGISFAGLTPWDERTRSSKEIVGSLMPKYMDIPGVLAFGITPASLGASGFSKPVEFVIKDSTSYQEMAANLEKFLAKVGENPRIVGVDTDLKINTPQLNIAIDRDRLADLGISVSELGRTLETLLASRKVTRFKQAGEQYEVMMQMEEDLRTEPQRLNDIYLRAASGELVALSGVVTLTPTVAPRDLNHFDRLRSVTVTANLAPGYALGEALQFMEAAAKDTLPPTASIGYTGQSREYMESSSGIYLVFVLALLFIYLVLAAQFESFIDPLVIMVTVPLSMLGALLLLKITGNTLNIYSQIGLVTLVGLITKHGILIVEFAGKQREMGADIVTAVIEAAHLRLRPILMTTSAMVLGAVPLAISSGAGAESREQLGLVIVGGMTFGTLLTLFVLPAFYTYVSRQPHARIEVSHAAAA
ncbi:MAG: efflux RND transporter permease subunit [Alphaproteobacteria bacterium]|nr:efflux RND transporter permease subunit [Alphaproteobacteria bacterium]